MYKYMKISQFSEVKVNTVCITLYSLSFTKQASSSFEMHLERVTWHDDIKTFFLFSSYHQKTCERGIDIVVMTGSHYAHPSKVDGLRTDGESKVVSWANNFDSTFLHLYVWRGNGRIRDLNPSW